MFTLTKSLLNLCNFVANLALPRLCVFWGHFWPKFGGGGHKNILVDQGDKGDEEHPKKEKEEEKKKKEEEKKKEKMSP